VAADPRRTVVGRWLAAGDAGDLDAFDDLLHPDAVVHAPLGLSTNSAEAEKAVWREALDAMPTSVTTSRRSSLEAMSRWLASS
jgi:ketosteroid isomerase-like protein